MKAPSNKPAAISQTRTLSESEVDAVTGGATATSTYSALQSASAPITGVNFLSSFGSTSAGALRVGPRPPSGSGY